MGSVKAAAHRNALVALTRFLAQDRVGGVMGPALEMIIRILRAEGGIAYRAEGDHLTLVAESGLPRRAKGWLARLPTDGEHWFVAQKVASAKKVVVDSDVAASRGGVGIRPALEEVGWHVLCGTPLRFGRRIHGVVVIAAQRAETFDDETLLFLDAVGTLLALVTEREEAVAQVRERRLDADKTAQLATLGLVAGAVARDLSTPLSSIAMQLDAQAETVERLRETLEDDPSTNALLNHVEVLTMDANEALRRAQSVNARLLALSRESQPEPLDLAQVVRDCGAMMAGELAGRQIALELVDDGAELWVDGRLEALQMMFVQLLVYAADQCHEARVSNPRIEIRLDAQGDRQVATISASARGESLPTGRVFDRLVGRSGPGSLGLELARQSIRAHDGHIELGKSDEGVTIAVVLPAARPAVEVAPPPLPARPSPPGAIPTIVWIDDDAAFVRAMCRNITRYRALVAGSIEEGRELLFGLTFAPALILCDVNLPDGLGTMLHADVPAALRERFVFVTGALLSNEIARYLKASGCPTLIKPIRAEEVYALLGDPDEAPRFSRTLGAHTSSSPPEERPPARLPDARESFVGSAPIEADGDAEEEHRNSFNDPDEASAEGDRQTLPETIDADDARRLRARRKAVTPVARPAVPEDDLA
jgi:signal transduction histidine kinase/ActR/RegA family two-component response regulator